MITLLKRRPGLSMDEFIDYYENKHARLGAYYLQQAGAIGYKRNYVQAVINPLTGEAPEADYDVVTEVRFIDRAAWEEGMAMFADQKIQSAMIADEEFLFDRSNTRMLLVERECDSDMAAI